MLLFFVGVFTLLAAAEKERERKRTDASSDDTFSLDGSTKVLFRELGDVKLYLHVFEPADGKLLAVDGDLRLKPGTGGAAAKPRVAVICFFGGSWSFGTPERYAMFCRYFAERGMVAISAEYRVFKRHRVAPAECVEDARAAIRFLRERAKDLALDPERIAVCGESAGGHIAACTGVLAEPAREGAGPQISSRPNMMILQCPAMDMTKPKRNEMCGGNGRAISPNHNVTKGVPPTLVQHGDQDTICLPEEVKAFEQAMKEAGNEIVLTFYAGQKHGFSAYREYSFDQFLDTTLEIDGFFVKHGWLEGQDLIAKWREKLQKLKDDGADERRRIKNERTKKS